MPDGLERRIIAGLLETRAETFLSNLAGRSQVEYRDNPELMEADFGRIVLSALAAADRYQLPLDIDAAVAAARSVYERDLRLVRGDQDAPRSTPKAE